MLWCYLRLRQFQAKKQIAAARTSAAPTTSNSLPSQTRGGAADESGAAPGEKNPAMITTSIWENVQAQPASDRLPIRHIRFFTSFPQDVSIANVHFNRGIVVTSPRSAAKRGLPACSARASACAAVGRLPAIHRENAPKHIRMVHRCFYA